MDLSIHSNATNMMATVGKTSAPGQRTVGRAVGRSDDRSRLRGAQGLALAGQKWLPRPLSGLPQVRGLHRRHERRRARACKRVGSVRPAQAALVIHEGVLALRAVGSICSEAARARHGGGRKRGSLTSLVPPSEVPSMPPFISGRQSAQNRRTSLRRSGAATESGRLRNSSRNHSEVNPPKQCLSKCHASAAKFRQHLANAGPT